VAATLSAVLPPSSRGLGRRPLTAETGVRIPVAVLRRPRSCRGFRRSPAPAEPWWEPSAPQMRSEGPWGEVVGDVGNHVLISERRRRPWKPRNRTGRQSGRQAAARRSPRTVSRPDATGQRVSARRGRSSPAPIGSKIGGSQLARGCDCHQPHRSTAIREQAGPMGRRAVRPARHPAHRGCANDLEAARVGERPRQARWRRPRDRHRAHCSWVAGRRSRAGVDRPGRGRRRLRALRRHRVRHRAPRRGPAPAGHRTRPRCAASTDRAGAKALPPTDRNRSTRGRHQRSLDGGPGGR
jgi:hypothetical protein